MFKTLKSKSRCVRSDGLLELCQLHLILKNQLGKSPCVCAVVCALSAFFLHLPARRSQYPPSDLPIRSHRSLTIIATFRLPQHDHTFRTSPRGYVLCVRTGHQRCRAMDRIHGEVNRLRREYFRRKIRKTSFFYQQASRLRYRTTLILRRIESEKAPSREAHATDRQSTC